MNQILYIIIQLILIILIAPAVNGVIGKIKAFSQKRKGPPLLQMYYDLLKLLKKDVVVSETASWIHCATPYISFATSTLAAMFFPLTGSLNSISFQGDMILAVYILAVGRFFMTLAALDTGSTFGGMGSSREVLISSLMEPALIIVLFTLGLISGSTSVSDVMLKNISDGPLIYNPHVLLIFASVLIILIAETSRIPVDDPSTHLELTMVHEAMLLEYSGKYLALMEMSSAIKQLIFITLLVNLFLPLNPSISGLSWPLVFLAGLLVYLLKVLFISIIVAFIEILTVKLRFFSVPNLAAISFALAFIGFMQYFVIGR
ncbi:MAG: formate hydrogenlyase [Dehalobacter sp. 4CP]|nr:formate hydrogenlyase [Dehalobacter sp. 4CP]